MFSIQRTYSFSAAHRLEGHPKCGRLHGHNYRVTVELARPTLVEGMVLDFGDVDKYVKPWIDAFDHKYLASIENIQSGDPYRHAGLGERPDDIVDVPIFRSTAEDLSRFLADELRKVLPVRLLSVTVEETDRNSATFTPDES